MSDPTRQPRATRPLQALPSGRPQIHLTGFMGVGKSTVAARLARRLLWNFIDLDAVVARHAGKEVRRIFADDGESVFRTMESHVLRQVALKPMTVVALGGGTLIDADNRKLSAAVADVVWLRCSIDEIERRCSGVATGRPLWGSRTELEALLRARLPGYESAKLTVDASAGPQDVAGNILRELRIEGRP